MREPLPEASPVHNSLPCRQHGADSDQTPVAVPFGTYAGGESHSRAVRNALAGVRRLGDSPPESYFTIIMAPACFGESDGSIRQNPQPAPDPAP